MGTISEQTKSAAFQNDAAAQSAWVKDELLEFIDSLSKVNKLESALEAFDVLGCLTRWPSNGSLKEILLDTLSEDECTTLFELVQNARYYETWSTKQSSRGRSVIPHKELLDAALDVMNSKLKGSDGGDV